ncbi:transcription initiation factor TFIID subunit 5 isoform X1 [Macadamia integrifolia]|uniref:transcription initiation factor TFIID subunit 5 isoform X1 n=2 Tax=Macadamia integrifolia TaxID=60698 RepID=UPI001C4FD150|nr:transcription initiation factor TFIID subunit 5 isoform X1 [Macadamia integrifolia]XP_042482195.1 transcription initiation factor TFIID subunit 5 isoform X1 [Macadamia integrifolia]
MEEDEIEKAVLAYLKKKGFKQTELTLQEEQSKSSSAAASQTDPEVAKKILTFSESENGPAQYHEGYSKLRSWTYSSLDLYKHELLRVLYPVFIHCFMDLVAKGHTQEARTFFNSFREDHEMMHLRDLQKLEGVLSPLHLEEMEFAHTLRQSKINIKMCQYSYELLLQYLQKTQSITILGIINEHINFQVSPGQPSSISDDADVVTLVGSSHETAKQINQQEIRWGLLEDSLEDRLEKAGGLMSDSEKADGENKEGDLEENKKRSVDGGKQGASVKKLKKDKVVGATGKTIRSETNTVSVAPRVKPELTLPVMPTEVEHSILEDLRNRVQLGSLALPSVSFYTFINTHNGLNCSSISHDGSLVAGGFSDSSLKVWDMLKIGQQTDTSSVQGENESTPSENLLGTEDGKRSYSLFQGHAGPVYSAAFSPLGDFLLSSSADSTVRLWSTQLNANLVCYKGHNYPVWDVQFSPVGHYFASSSHDRTARIWSMDRIQPLRIMAGHLSDVDCVQWHMNCNYIATGSSDKTVRLWDVQSGECVRIFIGHRSMILSLAMSPDGRYMASGDEDGMIMMWDLSSGRCVTPLMGHTSCVWTLAFSCEGSLLASGSADCTVKLWDVTASTKTPRTEENKAGSTNRLRSLKTLPTKSTPVYSLRFSRRNLLFAAGVLSKSV